MNNTMKLRSGATIPQITKKEAEQRDYLTRNTLSQMHLTPVGDPVAFDKAENGSLIYYFDPQRVDTADPELWYFPKSRKEKRVLDSGTVIDRMSIKRAASCSYYTKERLLQMHFDTIEEPVAFTIKGDGSVLYFYDKKTALRQPLMCVSCEKFIRYKKKLCHDCYAKDLIVRREAGDLHRNSIYNMDRDKVLFFDLELTGVYTHDEIISVSIIDGNGEMIMNTFVKPVHKKRWKQTEKIHGITPAMVEDAPSLEELTPQIKEILNNSQILIAYGISTDYSHIKHIYKTQKEQEKLRAKTRCCANEFVRYLNEHRPDLRHGSLIDAMACFEIGWDGIPHSSLADTVACMRVWEALFPNYYKGN